MGPNLYATPPEAFTQCHQDGHGTVDSGHLCLAGYNEVVMIRRLSQRHKLHALALLKGKDAGLRYDGLYDFPHGDGLVRVTSRICDFAQLVLGSFIFIVDCQSRAKNQIGQIQMQSRNVGK
jgi:hypothetical protein